MPIYEFKCQACKKINEVIMGLKDPQPKACTKCGKGPLAKIMSRPSRINKLTDWNAEYEKATLKHEADNPLSTPLPDNMEIDSTGHLVEIDPNEPKPSKSDEEAS